MILEESFGKSTDFISDGMNAFERNVKRIGDCLLAFIGPRPERKFYIDQIMERDPRYRFLYQIRPGSDLVCHALQRLYGYAGRCFVDYAMTYNSIWSTARGGSISRYW